MISREQAILLDQEVGDQHRMEQTALAEFGELTRAVQQKEQLRRQRVSAAFAIEAIEERILRGGFEQRRVAERFAQAACERRFADADRSFHRDEPRQLSLVDICDRRSHWERFSSARGLGEAP